MKHVKQMGIILGITMVGEILYQALPLPVPAGVYGLFIMPAALMSKAAKLENVEETDSSLMDIMTTTFISATMGIVECIGEVEAVLIPFLLIVAMSTILMMIVTGRMVQWVIQSEEAKEEK